MNGRKPTAEGAQDEWLDQQLEALWSADPFELQHTEKRRLLVPLLTLLDSHHRSHCPEYERVARLGFGSVTDQSLEALPFLAVRLFKSLSLKSVDNDRVFKTLQSSGTSGQVPARVFLDQATSKRQSRALVKILQGSLGRARLPMLIIDSPAVLRDRTLFSARGAGIQGLSFFGRDHTYALDESMLPNWQAIDGFINRYSDQPVLIFGFTFMVWVHLIQSLESNDRKLALPQGVLMHSGGWKKLEDRKVDNSEFKARARDALGVEKVINFYGMAEQVGSIFVECDQGHLHTPLFADVVVRDSVTLAPLPAGEVGLLQVVSVLPTSYPGHSLLTEDLGQLLGEDDCPCGRKGRYFSVLGRLPRSEVRGCSDTQQEAS